MAKGIEQQSGQQHRIDQLLEDVSVQWDCPEGPRDWFGVSTEDAGGIVAYFANETHAYLFRLALINATLNPVERGSNS